MDVSDYDELLPPHVHDTTPTRALEDTTAWRAVHASSFMMGGVTFVIGTCCLFFASGATLSAASYSIGSLGFLLVDLQEFVTFFSSSSCSLLINIACSMIGSALYLGGSIAFFPQLGETGTLYGLWGFVLGSSFIAASQCVKVGRLLISMPPPPSVWTSIGVEAGALFGALFFLVGTLLLQYDADAPINAVLVTWLAGSLSFTVGGICLTHRHFVLKLT
jgi:hypothetical protein